MTTTDLTLYAQWKQVVVLSVTYQPNGGIGNTNVYSVTPYTNYTIQDQGYRHSNPAYTFDSWNTRADGLGTKYTNGQSVYMTTTNLVLYAQWIIVDPQVYVIYDPNGGIGYTNIYTVPVNTYYTIRDQGYKHSNSAYTFDGWNTKPDGTGISYTNDKIIYLTSTIILYAQWKINEPTVFVIYDPNGGDGQIIEVSVPKNSYYTIKNQGYTWKNSNGENLFICINWNTDEDGLGIPYENGQTIFVTDTIILYAQWERDI
jgi:hypothetical protein